MVELSTGAYVITGEVEAKMTAEFLHACSNSFAPLIWFNSDGGETVQAKEIMRIIKQNQNVTIRVFGSCASSATLILQAAKRRQATSTCEFLVHYGEETIMSTSDRRRANKELKWMKKVYKEHCTVTPQTIGRWFNNETYMNAEQALKVGLIDEVIK